MAGNPVDRVIFGLGAASAALIGWMWLGFRKPLAELQPNLTLPDLAIGENARQTVADWFARTANTDAGAIFHNMLTGPELYFPLVFAAFLFLILLRLLPTARLFNRPVGGPLKAIVLVQPLTYVLADYAENALFLGLSGMAESPAWMLDTAPWLTAFKFLGLSVSLVFILRFALLSRIMPKA